MIIEIDNRQNQVDYTDELHELIEVCIKKTLEIENISYVVEVSVILADNNGIRELNREYRGIDRATDVLSFPLIDFDASNIKDLSIDEMDEYIDPFTKAVTLGDIVVSLEKATEQASEYGHSYFRELGFLTVHGMLHLLGYDHQDDDELAGMRELEERILSELNLVR